MESGTEPPEHALALVPQLEQAVLLLVHIRELLGRGYNY